MPTPILVLNLGEVSEGRRGSQTCAVTGASRLSYDSVFCVSLREQRPFDSAFAGSGQG